MKKLYTLLFVSSFTICCLQAQSLEELKSKKAELAAAQSEAQAKADGYAGEIGGLQNQIDILTGWTKGLAGNIGFDFNKSKNWVAAPNKNASSVGLGLGLSAYANKLTEKTLWRNKLVAEKAWQKVNLDGGDNPDGLFDSGTIDILNVSSLYGYRIHPKIALTGLGELNTSIENFLKPGSADIGIGATWTPSSNLVVVVHPFNYHYAWAADGTGDATGALGAKIRADYGKKYIVGGKAFNVGSTFTTFFPYNSDKSIITPTDGGDPWEAGLFEYTWVNTISFEILNGIGVGVGFGFRGADFESLDAQNYYKIGLSYNL